MTVPVEIKVYADAAALAEAAAQWILGAIRLDSSRITPFSLVLAGGSTPRGIYNRLADAEFSGGIGWHGVHFFWGDERCVPPDHPDSNYLMAQEALLNKIAVPQKNIHPIQTGMGCSIAAHAYEYELRHFFPGGIAAPTAGHGPDLVMLGLGEDGHVASLFPGSAALLVSSRWAVEVPHDAPPPPQVDRVTMTFDLINRAAQVVFVVSGSAKAAIVRQALHPEERFRILPVHLVRPARGKITWFLDEAAAGGLQG